MKVPSFVNVGVWGANRGVQARGTNRHVGAREVIDHELLRVKTPRASEEAVDTHIAAEEPLISVAVNANAATARPLEGVPLYSTFARNVFVSFALSIPLLFVEIFLALAVFSMGSLYCTAALLHPRGADAIVNKLRETIRVARQSLVRALKRRTRLIRRRIRELLADDDEDDAINTDA
ncbi:hypothetical protein NDN08_001775 [Rhodosorus marinus]|uniref:Transmembrane protein n=1 Tax=Rhodosorus marinus TaxID=101924 RepID=A0AAV8UVI0_9RHOD|nr:hypothetical protein NDN08_001775 [Rhodosorus marinus]